VLKLIKGNSISVKELAAASETEPKVDRGEWDCLNLCKQEQISILVTDDWRALPKLIEKSAFIIQNHCIVRCAISLVKVTIAVKILYYSNCSIIFFSRNSSKLMPYFLVRFLSSNSYVRNDQRMTKRSFFATLKDAPESKNFTNKALLYPIKPHLPLLSVPHPSR